MAEEADVRNQGKMDNYLNEEDDYMDDPPQYSDIEDEDEDMAYQN